MLSYVGVEREKTQAYNFEAAKIDIRYIAARQTMTSQLYTQRTRNRRNLRSASYSYIPSITRKRS